MKVFHAVIFTFVTALLGGPASAGLPRNVLIFHKQNGYIHGATAECVALLKKYLAERDLPAESSEDPLVFASPNLARYGVVIFLNTNYRDGAILNRSQEAAFEGFVKGGGGFVGLHSAVPLNGTFEETVWPWYARLFGARFRTHPPFRTAPLVIEDPTHVSTKGLPARFDLQDEWYAVQANPRKQEGIKVLATVDETGFPDGKTMGDHPVSWYQFFEGGRSWVTLVGHDTRAFSVPNYLAHVHGGILWAGGWDGSTAVEEAPGRSTGKARREKREKALRRSRGTLGVYRGRDGRTLEVRSVTGRHIEAIR